MGRLKGGVLGIVTPDKVTLQHLGPFRLYAGLLRFTGSFSQSGGTVSLSGKFEVNNPTGSWHDTMG